MPKQQKEQQVISRHLVTAMLITALLATAGIIVVNQSGINAQEFVQKIRPPELNRELYDLKLNALAHILPATSTASSTATTTSASSTPTLWPAKAAYPKYGALLPFNRIVAYYGNFYSKAMGALGEYEPEVMLGMLMKEVERWNLADPSTPAMPALNYIAVTAQGSAGEDGMYRLRMPDAHIEKAVGLAREVQGIVFLEVQVGLSSIPEEVTVLDKWLAMPDVHLALDPEFSMKNKKRPGSVIGTVDATDVNWAIEHLSQIVRDNNLPPKLLIVHRFTENMVTNYQNIVPTPEVQVIIVMDGWGTPELKERVYEHVITDEPVQFTGIKLFYKNDLKAPSSGLMPTSQILKLMPIPSYIQYQ